jgi:hypothetical protein
VASGAAVLKPARSNWNVAGYQEREQLIPDQTKVTIRADKTLDEHRIEYSNTWRRTANNPPRMKNQKLPVQF